MFVAVYLLSPYFACALPCCSFVEISPDVILRDEVRNVRICSIQNNRSIIKPRGWDFATTPTRFKVLNDYFRFVRVTSVLTPLASSFFSTSSALAFFECDYFFHLEIQSSILGYNS